MNTIKKFDITVITMKNNYSNKNIYTKNVIKIIYLLLFVIIVPKEHFQSFIMTPRYG